jgi:hypothetical protein
VRWRRRRRRGNERHPPALQSDMHAEARSNQQLFLPDDWAAAASPAARSASMPCITQTIMGESSKTIRAHVCALPAHSLPRVAVVGSQKAINSFPASTASKNYLPPRGRHFVQSDHKNLRLKRRVKRVTQNSFRRKRVK